MRMTQKIATAVCCELSIPRLRISLFLRFGVLPSQAVMIEFQAMIVSQGLKGLRFLDTNALPPPGHKTEFFEAVLSAHNHFVGRTADRGNSEFSKHIMVVPWSPFGAGARQTPPTSSRLRQAHPSQDMP